MKKKERGGRGKGGEGKGDRDGRESLAEKNIFVLNASTSPYLIVILVSAF